MRGICRALYDCPDQRLDESGPLVRVIVATHPAPTTKKKKRQVGLIRDGVVYELFWTKLPQSAFTASDVVSLSLHRGSFETALEDEDQEQEPDRWCSHSAWGRKPGRSWLSGAGTCDWSWGTSLPPFPVRTTEFAPARRAPNEYAPTNPASLASSAPASGYAPPPTATRLGKLAASPEPTFPSNRMEPCGVRQATCWSRMSTVESVMAACGSSIPPAFVTAVRVRMPRPVPMEREDHGQTAPGEHPASSPVGRLCSAPASRDWHRRHQRHACLLLHRRRFLGPSGRIPAYHGTSGWLAMLELKRRSGSRSPCSGFQTAWRPFSAWPLPNASSESREPSPASEKQASPSGFFCLFCLIAPPIHAPCSLVPFHPSTSLRADLLPMPVELTGNPESRLEHFGELIAHVVGHRRICPSASLLSHSAGPVRARSQGWFVRPYTG